MKLRFMSDSNLASDPKKVIYSCTLDLKGVVLRNFQKHDSLIIRRTDDNLQFTVCLPYKDTIRKDNREIIRYIIKDKSVFDKIETVLRSADKEILIKYVILAPPGNLAGTKKFTGVVKYVIAADDVLCVQIDDENLIT